MQHKHHHTEKRKEPRFSLSLPALISVVQDQENNIYNIHEVIIEDMSLHGMKSISSEPIPPGEAVQVSYISTQNSQEILLPGRIQWQHQEAKKYTAGIELYQQNIYLLSLEEISHNILAEMKGYQESTSTPRGADVLCADYFHSELFKGILYKTFHESLAKQMNHISWDLNLCVEYLENLLNNSSDKLSKPKIPQDKQQVLTGITRAKINFLNMVNLFQSMHEEDILSARNRIENAYESICLDKQIQHRVLAIRNKLNCLDCLNGEKFNLQVAKTNNITSSVWRVNFGLDFLLLYACQFVLLGKSSNIDMLLSEQKGNILLDIKDNGAGILMTAHPELMLNTNKEILVSSTKSSINDMHFWDQRQMCWLHHILMFFKEFSPTFLLRNNPGNNLLSLRLRVSPEATNK